MKKTLLQLQFNKPFVFLIFTFCSFISHAQVGINTTTPNATLDIKSSNQSSPTNTDGILIPKINVFPAINPTANQDGMLVYLTVNVGLNKAGFYYWHNASLTWLPLASGGWKLLGNAGTNPSINFLGTKDNKDLVFRRNNQISGRIGTSNTSFGLFSNVSNTIGVNNLAIGVNALQNNTTGRTNTALGYFSLNLNTQGHFNTGIGTYSLYKNSTGVNNIAIGTNAMYNNTSGNYNIAIGRNSLNSITSGQYNTAIGDYAYQNGTWQSYSTAIGYNSAITASNQIRIGNNTITSIGGFVNWTNVSDKRFKKNINYDNVPGLDFILKLKPSTYNLDIENINKFHSVSSDKNLSKYEKEKESILYSGFIAQEVENAAKEIGFDFSGVDKPKNENDYYGLRYAEFVVPLVKAVQEQNEKIEELELKITLLENLIKKNQD